MQDTLERLIAAIQNPYAGGAKPGEETIEVSKPASTAATLYERVRTAVDYQEEHLLRRNAILRIVKRLLGSDITSEQMSEHLLRELIWARYLPNKEIPSSFIKALVPIFEKYGDVLHGVEEAHGKRDQLFLWVLEAMSTELEYAIAPPTGEEAIVSYMYEEMKRRIAWDPEIILSDEQKDLLLYIAIHQTLPKSNRATLRFRVLTLYYPDWPGKATKERVQEIAGNLEAITSLIDDQINHPVTAKLGQLIRRRAGVFRVLRDMIEAEPDKFPALLDNPEEVDKAVKRELKNRTSNFKVRLRRSVLRSVMFLLITKTLLAMIIEMPYDILILKEIHWLPLAINIGFHPLFLAFIGLTVAIPERRNTTDYQEAIRALVVGADHELVNIRVKRSTFGTWSTIFSVVYGLMFVFTYGVIASILIQIGFNGLSAGLFLFFLSLVTFFGIRIRQSTREIVLSHARSGVLGTMFDFFMLPLVRAGRWLSLKVSKVNVFIYFFDFIVEAPFKVAVRFFESWIAFVREKKEEIE